MRCYRALITGAEGFIGQHLTFQLRARNVQVYGMKQNADNLSSENRTMYVGDIRDKKFVAQCLSDCQPNIIFHLAASKDRTGQFSKYYDILDTNFLGSLNLMTSALDLKDLQSIVLMGTTDEYGQSSSPFLETERETPGNAYGLSKVCMTHLGELLYKTSKLPCTILRPTVAYGPKQGSEMFLPSLVRSLVRNELYSMTRGEQTRDFLYVSDLINAIILASEKEQARGQIINIGSGISTSIASVALFVEKMMNKSNLLGFGEKPYRIGEIMNYTVDISKAKTLLGWQPRVSLQEGLRLTIDSILAEEIM